MQFRCLLTVALAAGAFGAAACSDDQGGNARPVTTTSASDRATTTTEAPTTSTTLDFETEVKLAALALLEIRNEVFQHPDVARLDEYIDEFCTCRERELGILEEFVANQRHWTGTAVEPLGIRIDSDDPSGPSFTLIARQPPGAIESPGGSQQVPEVELAPYVISLARNSGGQWRMNGLHGITMQRDAALRIIDEDGLP